MGLVSAELMCFERSDRFAAGRPGYLRGAPENRYPIPRTVST
jgi:hypothetical protein